MIQFDICRYCFFIEPSDICLIIKSADYGDLHLLYNLAPIVYNMEWDEKVVCCHGTTIVLISDVAYGIQEIFARAEFVVTAILWYLNEAEVRILKFFHDAIAVGFNFIQIEIDIFDAKEVYPIKSFGGIISEWKLSPIGKVEEIGYRHYIITCFGSIL